MANKHGLPQHGIDRRQFLGSAAAAAAAACLPLHLRAQEEGSKPKRIAMITTIYRYLSHGQHMGDRFLIGYPFEGEWHKPNMQIASLYVDQKPGGDLSETRAAEFGFKTYKSIADTLRCGGNKLAVDAVLIIAEHGDYPVNDKGQKQYPRFEFFEQCVQVFKEDGRAVPIYTDKALSYDFDKAKQMVNWSKKLHFGMLAGSSLPVTWRLPDVDVPPNAALSEALMVGENGTDDAMDFHALEALQCMVERRKGGETGVRAVQTVEGEGVWKLPFSRDLLIAALSRSDTPLGLTVTDGRTQDLVGSGELERLVTKPVAYRIEYRDGLKATFLNARGAVQDFTFAARLQDGRIISTQFLLTPEPNVTYSACLMQKAEELFHTGHPSHPIERTLLTSGTLAACHKGMGSSGSLMQTDHLNIHYKPPSASEYARA